MVYAKFGGQTECIMGNWKIENSLYKGLPPEAKNALKIRSLAAHASETNKIIVTLVTQGLQSSFLSRPIA